MDAASSPVNIQMYPPQIATEGFSSDSLSERSPEQHTKNRGKSRRANIIFFGKIQNGTQKRNLVYYSVILNTKMWFARFINLFTHMMNLLSYRVIYVRPNSSRKFKMAAITTIFNNLIVPINAIYKNVLDNMTTYVSSSYSLS